MNENEITFDNITFDELDTLLKFLSAKTKIKNIDINDVIEFIQTHENTKYYFDTRLSSSEPKDSMYVWLDTGFKDTRQQPLFISCLNTRGFFIGHIVGDPNSLMSSMANFNRVNEKTRIEKLQRFQGKYIRKTEDRADSLNEKYKNRTDEPKEQLPEEKETPRGINSELVRNYWEDRKVLPITEEIASLLILNTWNSISGLDRYIKVIGTRLQQLVEAKASKYYILNHIQSAICNTGLLSKFGEDIYVLYRRNLSFGFYTPYKVILDKQQYLSENYTKEQSMINLSPISFASSYEDYFLDTKIEDISFNAHDWLHIIEERRTRFPEDLQKMSDVALISQIKQSLDIGLKFQKMDRMFAKPYFSASTGNIAWTLPFFPNGDISLKPELVMVIARCGNVYKLKTILPFDDKVKDKLIDLSKYSRLW